MNKEPSDLDESHIWLFVGCIVCIVAVATLLAGMAILFGGS